ncbi:hypothetical protein RJT34_25696 [Clitoria ternatea]|uniref:Uncharacterized protein n=1 Tax=Clitoria ternatea TaxID=43366 RepID=A0AAN9ILH3_CLITE
MLQPALALQDLHLTHSPTHLLLLPEVSGSASQNSKPICVSFLSVFIVPWLSFLGTKNEENLNIMSLEIGVRLNVSMSTLKPGALLDRLERRVCILN